MRARRYIHLARGGGFAIPLCSLMAARKEASHPFRLSSPRLPGDIPIDGLVMERGSGALPGEPSRSLFGAPSQAQWFLFTMGL